MALEHRHIRSVGTHMTHTVWTHPELYRLRIYCRRVLVGCAVGGCVTQSGRYIDSIQVSHYSFLRGMVQEGKVCNHNIRAYELDSYTKSTSSVQ